MWNASTFSSMTSLPNPGPVGGCIHPQTCLIGCSTGWCCIGLRIGFTSNSLQLGELKNKARLAAVPQPVTGNLVGQSRLWRHLAPGSRILGLLRRITPRPRLVGRITNPGRSDCEPGFPASPASSSAWSRTSRRGDRQSTRYALHRDPESTSKPRCELHNRSRLCRGSPADSSNAPAPRI